MITALNSPLMELSDDEQRLTQGGTGSVTDLVIDPFNAEASSGYIRVKKLNSGG